MRFFLQSIRIVRYKNLWFKVEKDHLILVFVLHANKFLFEPLKYFIHKNGFEILGIELINGFLTNLEWYDICALAPFAYWVMAWFGYPLQDPDWKVKFCLYFLPDNQNEEFHNFNPLIYFKCIFPLDSNISNPINNPFK